MDGTLPPGPQITSKALVYVCAQLHHDLIARQYHMDMCFDEKTSFLCKFRTSARLVKPDKKVFIYLMLDARHVQTIEACKDDQAIPHQVTNAFVKQGRCSKSTDIMSLRFVLKRHAPVISPDAALQKRPSICRDMDALLQIGQCALFTVYLPSSTVNKARLTGLCTALADESLTLKYDANVIKTLYAGGGSREILRLDQLWNSDDPPSYDASTKPGASDDTCNLNNSPDSYNLEPTTTTQKRAKRRRIESPECLEAPTKQKLLASEKIAEPWELAMAAQSVQLAALSAQLAALRDEMQRPVPMAHAATQTESVTISTPHEPSPQPLQHHMSPSQASTIENTLEDRITMLEDKLMDEQKQRTLLEEQINTNDQKLNQTLEMETDGLQVMIRTLDSRVDDLEGDFQHVLKQDLEDNIEQKAWEMRAKLEEYIDFRLEDVEEVVKNDVRVAMETASCRLELDWTIQ
jgi:hypothetical protein